MRRTGQPSGGDDCPGGVCDGSGFVLGPPRCTPECNRLFGTHGPHCPSRPVVECTACAKAALGDDLAWSAF